MKINYSCVIDKHEKFKKQGWLWLNSLIKLGRISPSNIWVHFIDGIEPEYINKCAALGVNIRIIEPFGDKKYCNKIAQMSNAELKDSDAVILMDTDMIMLENFERDIDLNCISAKIVDMENPPIDTIDELFKIAGLNKALPDYFTGYKAAPTYGANFNGGVYIIPAQFYDIIESGWQKWACWLLENENGKPLYDIGREAHIDQVSFCMTVHENKLDIKYLSPAFNYPLPYDYGFKDKLYVLHYHDRINADFSKLTPDFELHGNIKKSVDKADNLISEVQI